MSKIQLIATSAFGVESIVARELKKLGYNNIVENGRVMFEGNEEAVCRANIWLRSADRVLVKVGEFNACTFEELFEKTKALPWHEWIPQDAEFPVTGKSVRSKLFSVSDCQSIVKKAIVENLKQKYKIEWFEEKRPRYKIEVSLLKDKVVLTIDTSGAGLHKRGYRKHAGPAPLKETLASAMIMTSRWNENRALIDPFCGSGTIPIESALIGNKIAPGLKREFESEKWGVIPYKFWNRAREEAYDIGNFERKLNISGNDISEEAVSLTRHHASEAGVDNLIHIQRMDFKDIKSRHKYGFIICNPPYGERVGEKQDINNIYDNIGRVFSTLDTWSYYILSSNPDFERIFGCKANKRRKLYNGRIQCTYYQFFGPPPP